MKKSIKAILSSLGICLFVFFCCSPVAYAVDGSKQTAYEGHLCKISGSTKQVCANCHIPHGGSGMRIWARGKEIQGKTKVGVKDLCASCHHANNNDFPGIQSGLLMGSAQWTGGKNSDKNNLNGNVFLGGSANHVMGPNLKPTQTDGSFVSAKAEVIGFPFSQTEGFYCGSCHNPHQQPNSGAGKDESGQGDYLRFNDKTSNAGITHDRKQFCRQCHPQQSKTKVNGTSVTKIHPDASGAPDPQCEACHRPHDGYPSADNTGVFVYEVKDGDLGDLNGFSYGSSSPKRNLGTSSVTYDSAKCVWCHIDSDEWPNAPKLRKDHGQHPMNRYWAKTSCAVDGCHSKSSLPKNETDSTPLFQLDGFSADGSAAPIDKQIFSCTCCHTHHSASIEGNPSFLDHASFKEDNTSLCVYCHNYTDKHPKTGALLGANSGLHYKTRTDATNHITRTFKSTSTRSEKVVKCGGCMFCHFIHQNEKDDPRVLPTISPQRADIKALMRIPPKELNWGSQGDIVLRSDPLNRYEAMCYGCHGNSNIVSSYEKNGSLLNPTAHQSHRFACKPVSANTNANITAMGGVGVLKFPKADGIPGASVGVMDDYGTVDGQIYCGTCHDVHINSKPPYLYPLSANDHASPYKSDEVGRTFSSQADRDGFCEQCHCTANSSDPMAIGSTHPVGANKVPVVPHTGAEFPKQFAGGGSGSPLGITAGSNTTKDGVLCLTCHNVHAAATAWDGAITSESRPAVDSNGKKTGKHGQLLVMDNYLKDPGSDMCGACHVKYGNDEQSQAH